MILKNLFLSLLLVAGFHNLAFGSEESALVRLGSAEPIKKLGLDIYLVSKDKARIFTPNKKHIEIDKSTQTLRAYDEKGSLFMETLVSTGEPGIDEEGWEKSETLPGFHKIIELMPFRRWSKDENVKMLNWIGIEPGIEKGIHSLDAVGKFADYETFLGKKRSHGCIRVSREASTALYAWIGDDWKKYAVVVYIYEKPIPRKDKDENLMLLILESGLYSYPLESHDEPKLVKDGEGTNSQLGPGDILVYKKEDGIWKLLKRGSH
ncbi:MAG: L,D-transpeptidase [Deltaproteobacteria bacterium]|nr:L,D-transpeptidase [Deltaproteobacteria bacterium]MBI3755901.1 L,D-transpeptidase [Deltaproteobacteria bacterium]